MIAQTPQIEAYAKKYASFNHFFFMGRRYMFPTSLEAALKLKEISYLSASGYPAGELKHGPIALVNSSMLEPTPAQLAVRLPAVFHLETEAVHIVRQRRMHI